MGKEILYYDSDDYNQLLFNLCDLCDTRKWYRLYKIYKRFHKTYEQFEEDIENMWKYKERQSDMQERW